ncbi:MAG: hypothetical protein BWY76_03035 [bacterium ADurb.Bin429]|nr:MAG: hypothetical protein BWY76_03035 [bacterium ADurb.Bin429]
MFQRAGAQVDIAGIYRHARQILRPYRPPLLHFFDEWLEDRIRGDTLLHHLELAGGDDADGIGHRFGIGPCQYPMLHPVEGNLPVLHCRCPNSRGIVESTGSFERRQFFLLCPVRRSPRPEMHAPATFAVIDGQVHIDSSLVMAYPGVVFRGACPTAGMQCHHTQVTGVVLKRRVHIAPLPVLPGMQRANPRLRHRISRNRIGGIAMR